MKTTEYLYNCSPQDFADIPYREAIRIKRDKARALRDTLYQQINTTSVPYGEIYDLLERHYAVAKALKHNEALLE